MKKLIYSLLFATAILSSCSNDIKLNAGYKEIAVVYGLLDKNDTVHYIRIQRGFQNTGSAAQTIAQIPDSLYFDSLEVKITDLTTSQVYTLTKELSIIKDSGYFQNKINILYRFSNPLSSNDRYRLDIKNVYTGNGVSGETPVVGNITGNTSPPGDTFDLLAGKKVRAYAYSGINARAYDVFYRFKYDELDSVTGIIIAHKYIDYYVQRGGLTNTLAGGSAIDQTVESDNIFTLLGNAIPVTNGIQRVATNFDICFAGAADDLNVYEDVSKPSIGIVQKKPEFTNVSNGYGIFSSRNVFFKKHPVSGATQSALRKNAATRNQGWK